MEAQSQKMILSGIEPIDELRGGLESGSLYLVHGEPSGRSLFGVKFLIEGLDYGDNAAMVIRDSPEEAVRRFAKLGYNCLEDVYSGRLVILEYSDDIIQKVGGLGELTPVLRELEFLLGETKPGRLIFDPVTSVLAGVRGSLEARAGEFCEWARSFGATVVLIADGSDREVIKAFEPFVADSFRLGSRETRDGSFQFIGFDKSPISDHAIEVDPSRGIFLLGGPYEPEEAAPQPPSIADLKSIRDELRSVRGRIHSEEFDPLQDIDLVGDSSDAAESPVVAESALEDEVRQSLETRELTPIEEHRVWSRHRVPEAAAEVEELDLSFETPPPASTPATEATEENFDELENLVDQLISSSSPLDLDLIEPESAAPPFVEDVQPVETTASVPEDEDAGEVSLPDEAVEVETPPVARHGRAADLRIDSATAARTAEELLSPSEQDTLGDDEVPAKYFKVLIIEDQRNTCDLVAEALADYELEIAHDGVSGLAKLISFKPDLVVLDFDLPIIDGSKMLSLIRSALSVPIIILSGSLVRKTDHVMATEMGADYYITKPFSAKELKQNARQSIARYRHIDSWIINRGGSRGETLARDEATASLAEPVIFVPYKEFVAEVEKRVRSSMSDASPFSILGCQLSQMTRAGGERGLELLGLVRKLARERDLTSTNARNDLVVLLDDADDSGARAFAMRLRAHVIKELNEEPSIWTRSFPALEESSAALSAANPQSNPQRRSSDRLIN